MVLDEINTPFWGRAQITTGTVLPWFKTEDLPLSLQHYPLLIHDFAVFVWFTDQYVRILSTQPLMFADLRYMRGWSLLQAQWGTEFPDNLIGHVHWRNPFPSQIE